MPLIRPFRKSDLKSVMHISDISLNENYDPQLYQSISDSWNGVFLVAVENGMVIGFINGLFEGGDFSRILMLAVHPEHRNMGIGGHLLESFISMLSSLGVRKVILEVRPSNLKARRFYINRNFRPDGTVKDFYMDGEDCIRMVLSLPQGECR